MMRHGITPSSTVQCPANLTVDTYTFGNYSASAGAPAAKLIYEIPAEANALIAEAVSFVEQEQGVVHLLEVDDFAQRAEIAVHGENGLC